MMDGVSAFSAVDRAHDFELVVLGAILVRNECYWDCAQQNLKAHHFADELHARLYAAMAEMIEAGGTVSPILLKPKFVDDPDLVQRGGLPYLGRLAVSSAGVIKPADYARGVREWAARRDLAQLGCWIVEQAGDPHVELGRIVADGEAALDQARPPSVGDGMVSLAVALREAQEENERVLKRGAVDGVTFGLKALDDIVGGAAKSDLVILAGRPGMGKSALALHIAEQVTRQGKRVVFFTGEMSHRQLANRLLGQQAGVSVDSLRRGTAGPREVQATREAIARLDHLPLTIKATSAVTVGELRAHTRRLLTQGTLDLLIVDNLQLMRGPGARENRVQEMSAITSALKALAVALNVPILALSHLNRQPEQRDDKRPLLADLRESGSIEQDADTVIFLYREYEYLSKREPRNDDQAAHERWQRDVECCASRAELIVAKNRHGATGAVTVGYDAALMAFRNEVPL
jgi:replicative DNA helicase